MTALPVDEWVEGPQPAAMFEWQRIIRRLSDEAIQVDRVKGSTVKLVAVMLATYADPDGSRVYPSDARLSRVCLLSLSSTNRAKNWLVANGFLQLSKQGNRHTGQANEYRLTLPLNLLELNLLSPNEDHAEGIV
ncbi:hypothetical protein A6I84_03460 [Prescottella equi]|nr:hypothetical protein A6I84_03460 [Prescottella equi]